MTDFNPLLRWRRDRVLMSPPIGRYNEVDVAYLVDSLTCEKLRYEATPPRFYAAVVAFRHLGQAARHAKVRRFLGVSR
jgi:hypothetical protein